MASLSMALRASSTSDAAGCACSPSARLSNPALHSSVHFLSNGLLAKGRSLVHKQASCKAGLGFSFCASQRSRRGFAQPEASLLEFQRDFNLDALAAEAPGLLAMCEDLDAPVQIAKMREEAKNGLQDLSFKAIARHIDSWSYEQMTQGLEWHRTTKPPSAEVAWNLDLAMQNMHLQACLEAIQQLSRGVDSSFDWEVAAMELHLRALGVRHLVPGSFGTMSSEEQLWNTWVVARDGMAASDNEMAENALALANSCGGDEELLQLRADFQNFQQRESMAEKQAGVDAIGTAAASVGATLAGLLLEGGLSPSALADDNGLSFEPMAESIEAAARAPEWLGPAVLAFPVVTYALFNYYREKVNPGAKVVDWMFGVMAVVIVANLVLIATLGVRLY